MKLKKILTTLDGLNEAIAGLYTKKEDGKFHLELEDDDAAELRRAKEHEVGLRKIAENERDAAKAELETATGTITKLQNDAGKDKNQLREELTAEHTKVVDKLKADHAKEKSVLEASVKKVFVHDVAQRIASEITDVPDLILPLLEQRLQVEIVDGEPLTRVLAADGKASAMTPDNLRDEYLQNPKFARIMRANGSSGGGASGGHGGGGASKKLSEMGDAERTEWAKRDPDGFQRAVDADKAATK